MEILAVLTASALLILLFWWFVRRPRPRADFERDVLGDVDPVGRNDSAPLSPERFQLSAFAPDSAAPGATLLVQAYVHFAAQAPAVAEMAQRRDADARRRGETPLAASPKPGQHIRVTMQAVGLEVDEPEQNLVWSGTPISADFELKMPKEPSESAYTLVLRVEVEGLPIGSLKLRLAVGATAQRWAGILSNPLPKGEFHAYDYVFLSYSSKDRERVLDVAQGFDRLGIRFFQDVLTLRAGDAWKQRIEAEIKRSDAMMLFWSKAAAESMEVRHEAETALRLQQASTTAIPHILPFILEQPPPLPPESLKAIHFNDPISCIRAVAARGTKGAPADM